ncbi:MAG: hypothetical protein IJ841_06195 [Prevotella sp.]|nr:hypothetical protein [Prevotella sp.]
MKNSFHLGKQFLLLALIGLICSINISAATYSFKAENSDGVIIYYTVNDNEATVVKGDEKYSDTVNIPEKITK